MTPQMVNASVFWPKTFFNLWLNKIRQLSLIPGALQKVKHKFAPGCYFGVKGVYIRATEEAVQTDRWAPCYPVTGLLTFK